MPAVFRELDRLPKAERQVLLLSALEELGAGVQTQFTYLDVGMNFAATLDETEHGARLNSKVEESGLAGDKSIVGVDEPVIRQTVLQGTSFLTLDKPLMLGSVDIVGSTRHVDIEVVMEQVQ